MNRASVLARTEGRSLDGDPKPWTIKGVAPEARNAAIEAANKSGLTQGAWLNRGIFTVIDRSLAEVPKPKKKWDLDDLSAALRLCKDISDLSGRPISDAVVQALESRLCEYLSG